MITKNIWQTWKHSTPPSELKYYTKKLQELNPDYKYSLCSDSMCRDLVLNVLGSEILDLYDQLPQAIMRADFWRILVVYQYGGIYCDLDLECTQSFSSILNSSIDIAVVKDLDNIANFFIAATPKHPVLKLCLDYMIEEAKNIITKDTQSFGMHSLHRSFREYYNVEGTNYPNTDSTQTLSIQNLTNLGIMIHHARSGMPSSFEYTSWRDSDRQMLASREQAKDVVFFTTFNKSGFDLYGQTWIKTFIALTNYYPSFRAKIYYEGNVFPNITHPNIEWINFSEGIPHHNTWKKEFLQKSQHDDYVRTMGVKFSYKSFVIQHVLDTCTNNYAIWLDGDCVFLPSDYTNFPQNILDQKFLACQVEENWDLNHIESGFLCFDMYHKDTIVFNSKFKENYNPDLLVVMGQPYDGFVISKSLINSGTEYVNLNKNHGYGGIQSDPGRTFQHPQLKSKFIHNIGWTGKNQYQNWDRVSNTDPIYNTIKTFLFGGKELKEHKLKRHKVKLQSVLSLKEKFLLNNS